MGELLETTPLTCPDLHVGGGYYNHPKKLFMGNIKRGELRKKKGTRFWQIEEERKAKEFTPFHAQVFHKSGIISFLVYFIISSLISNKFASKQKKILYSNEFWLEKRSDSIMYVVMFLNINFQILQKFFSHTEWCSWTS